MKKQFRMPGIPVILPLLLLLLMPLMAMTAGSTGSSIASVTVTSTTKTPRPTATIIQKTPTPTATLIQKTPSPTATVIQKTPTVTPTRIRNTPTPTKTVIVTASPTLPSPTATETSTPQGGEGCTPGFWKQPHHFDSWVGYVPSDSFEDVFGVTADLLSGATLLDALESGGGGEEALGRHAVAALLNTTNPDVGYAFTTAEVIAMVQEAYATGEFELIKDQLAAENELLCPLD